MNMADIGAPKNVGSFETNSKEVVCAGCRRTAGTMLRLPCCSHDVCEGCIQNGLTHLSCPLCGVAPPEIEQRASSAAGKSNGYGLYTGEAVDSAESPGGRTSEQHSVGQVDVHSTTYWALPPAVSSAPILRPPALSPAYGQRSCQLIEQREPNDTSLGSIDIQRTFYGTVDRLSEKIRLFGDIYNHTIARGQLANQARTQSREKLQRIRESVTGRIDYLVNEVDQRFGLEQSMCSQMAKTIGDMVQLLHNVHRMVCHASQRPMDENDSAAMKPLVQLLDFSVAQIEAANNCLERCRMDHTRRPIPVLSLLSDYHLQQLAYIGGFDGAAPAGQYQAYLTVPPPQPFQSPVPRFSPPGAVHVRPGFQCPPSAYPFAVGSPRGFSSVPSTPRQYYQPCPMAYSNTVGTQPAPCQYPDSAKMASAQGAVDVSNSQPRSDSTRQSPASRPFQLGTSATNIGTAPTPPAQCPSANSFTPAPMANVAGQRSDIEPNLAFRNCLAAALAQASPGQAIRRRKASTISEGSTVERKRRRAVPKGQRGSRGNAGALNVPDWRSSVHRVVEEVASKLSALDFSQMVTSHSTPLHRYPPPAAPVGVLPQLFPVGDPVCITFSPTMAVESPVESRLVIDEAVPSRQSDVSVDMIDSGIETSVPTDSGIQSAITVEENNPADVKPGVIKIEVSSERQEETVPNNATTSKEATWGRPQVRDQASEATEEMLWDELCSVCNTDDGRPVRRCNNDSCGRVYHSNHHVPVFDDLVPERDHNEHWLCTLCAADTNHSQWPTSRRPHQSSQRLSDHEQRMCERILLSLYIHPESVAFHEAVDASLTEYYKLISRPMDFSLIRKQLATRQYAKVEDFLADLNQVFTNSCIFYNEVRNADNCDIDAIVECYCGLVRTCFPSLSDQVREQVPTKRAGLSE